MLVESHDVILFKCSYGIAAIAPFSHRLAFDNLPKNIQRLRCKVNFEALVFVPRIAALGKTLVNRLRYPSEKRQSLETEFLKKRNDDGERGSGKFVVLHLRFDKVCPLKQLDHFIFAIGTVVSFFDHILVVYLHYN